MSSWPRENALIKSFNMLPSMIDKHDMIHRFMHYSEKTYLGMAHLMMKVIAQVCWIEMAGFACGVKKKLIKNQSTLATF